MDAVNYQTKIGVGLHQPAFSTPAETLAEIDAKLADLRHKLKRLERRDVELERGLARYQRERDAELERASGWQTVRGLIGA